MAKNGEERIKTEDIDTFDKLIERLYEQELIALRIASADGYRVDYKTQMRGHADGIACARKKLIALREDGYVIGC